MVDLTGGSSDLEPEEVVAECRRWITKRPRVSLELKVCTQGRKAGNGDERERHRRMEQATV